MHRFSRWLWRSATYIVLVPEHTQLILTFKHMTLVSCIVVLPWSCMNTNSRVPPFEQTRDESNCVSRLAAVAASTLHAYWLLIDLVFGENHR